MALVIPQIKKDVETAVMNELNKQFPKLPPENKDVKDSWEKQAKIASAVAEVIIKAILSSGIVTVTVATTGTAAAQTGSGTGTIT